VFNGFTVTGLESDTPGGVLVLAGGELRREAVRLDLSSLASQGVGPALDHLEMSYEGRTWPMLGKKLLHLAPLGRQRVAATDSVLGAMANPEGVGLTAGNTYRALIERAFHPRYWESGDAVTVAGVVDGEGKHTQIEYNFALFWGLALQAYQSTLNSDDTPFDRYMEGNPAALTPEQVQGLQFFQGPARCNECHNGAEFSAAAFNANRTTRNHAFERTGVRPAAEDLGSGNGAFKSIGLRNVEFTGPYFHNGGQATLEQVIDFYRRGGDFTPVANDLRPFNANPAQRAALVEFLKALSDDRVRYERAPFDHPELCVPIGHVEGEAGSLTPPGEGARYPRSAAEQWRLVPAVGAEGNSAPLRTFDEMLRGAGSHGARAHTLTEACPVTPAP
jgi:cytochrome c peroxidase